MRITGRVVHGDKVGRTLGYPTANMEVSEGFELPDGVYAAWAWITEEGACTRHAAMANFGVKPTFPGKEECRVLELHLIGFEGDLYDRKLTVQIVEFIRPEQKFADARSLRTQIEKDEIKTKSILCI